MGACLSVSAKEEPPKKGKADAKKGGAKAGGGAKGGASAKPKAAAKVEQRSSADSAPSAPAPATAAAAPVTPVSSKKASITANVLGKNLEDVKNYYTIGRELGRGQFGVTYLCTDKATGEQYACKSIAKRKLVTKEDVEDVKREVAIMHHLAGGKKPRAACSGRGGSPRL